MSLTDGSRAADRWPDWTDDRWELGPDPDAPDEADRQWWSEQTRDADWDTLADEREAEARIARGTLL